MKIVHIVSTLALTALISGCTGSRTYYQAPPEPLQPAPTGNVQSNQLQPIDNVDPNNTNTTTANNAGVNNSIDNTNQNTQVASVDTQTTTTTSSSGQKVTKTAALGAWNATVSGANCKLILSLTQNSDKSYRAAPLRCPNGLANVKAWNVEGNQLVLKNSSGESLVRLNRTGGERYQGGIVTLSR